MLVAAEQSPVLVAADRLPVLVAAEQSPVLVAADRLPVFDSLEVSHLIFDKIKSTALEIRVGKLISALIWMLPHEIFESPLLSLLISPKHSTIANRDVRP